MGCGPALVVLTAMLCIGTGLYVGGGIAGLSGTLTLMEKYGPQKGSGNPALDDPPEMQYDPETGEWRPINPDKPGNRVPQAFAIVKYVLIAWAVVIFVTAIIFVIDSIRSETVILNRLYEGQRTSDSSISCTAGLAGYSIFLAIVWFVQAGFAVLPLLEYRITMQRCWDLENPNFAPTTKRLICVDLVQYGLVLFKETADGGYGLVCGPGGNYDPPRGDLEGFCESYSPTFTAFILCFAGAGIGIIATMLFAIHHSTNFSYLKVRRYERGVSGYYIPTNPEKQSRQNLDLSRASSLSNHSDYRIAPEPYARHNGANLANPNYGVSIADTGRSQRNPVPEVMSFQRYRPEEHDVGLHDVESVIESSVRSRELRSNHRESARPPVYDSSGPPSYDGDSNEYLSSKHEPSRRKHRDRRRNRYERSRRDRGSEHSWRESRNSDGGGRRHRRRESEDGELSERWSSDDGRSSKVTDRNRRRKSSRPKSSERLELREESPTSDYYMTEDKQRRSATRWG